jgi:hypothetical protein
MINTSVHLFSFLSWQQEGLPRISGHNLVSRRSQRHPQPPQMRSGRGQHKERFSFRYHNECLNALPGVPVPARIVGSERERGAFNATWRKSSEKRTATCHAA